MNSVSKEDVCAEVVLRDLKKRERLKKIVDQSGFEYYTGGHILGLAGMPLSAAILTWLLLRENVPFWGLMVCGVALISVAESARLRGRFEALLELTELEKQHVNKLWGATDDNICG